MWVAFARMELGSPFRNRTDQKQSMKVDIMGQIQGSTLTEILCPWDTERACIFYHYTATFIQKEKGYMFYYLETVDTAITSAKYRFDFNSLRRAQSHSAKSSLIPRENIKGCFLQGGSLKLFWRHVYSESIASKFLPDDVCL